MNNHLKWIVACALTSLTTSILAQENMHWYKNETACADVAVTVRSYCKRDEDLSMNSFCTKQQLTLKSADGKLIEKNNLLEKEPPSKEFHVLGSIRCVNGRDDKPYLYMIFDNGGNCDACEIDALMDLNGKWKKYDKKWFVSGSEKREIQKRSENWFKAKSFYLENKTEIK
jgi:hypothetical protein